MVRILILGFGRMGKCILTTALKHGHEVVGVVESPESKDLGKDAGELAGVGRIGVTITSAENLREVITKTQPEVGVDFSRANATLSNLPILAEEGVNAVIGTTGFSEEDKRTITNIVRDSNIGVVFSPNMSIGVNVFWKIIKEATKMLPDYDVEIVEIHHRFKLDSPSGTALKTAEIIVNERGLDIDKSLIYGRRGKRERTKEEIGIHALRAGDIVGEHIVLYATLGERLEFTHRAHSRDAFALGAIKAVEFIRGRKGMYEMSDVITSS